MIANITITNTITNADGSIFGFGTTELGEGVYIPVSSMCKVQDPEVGNRISVILSQNSNNSKGTTPWYCAALNNPDILDDTSNDNALGQGNVKDAILEYINSQDWMVTSDKAAEYVDCSQQFASDALHNLHLHEKISKISISKGPNRKASHTAWCPTDMAGEIFHEINLSEDDD